MLGKLIKYEWKSTYKIGGIMLLTMLAVTLLGSIMLQMPWMRSFFGRGESLGEAASVVLTFSMFIGFLVYVFVLSGITYGILIFMGLRFYRTMYTDQGYLTHTLPVTANQLLISKILISGIWYLLIMAGVILSVVCLVASLMNGAMDPGSYSFAEFVDEMGSALDAMSSAMTGEMMGYVIHILVYILLAVLITPFSVMITIFGALTIGQLSRKYKGLVGVLVYFGIGLVNSVVVMIVEMIYSMRLAFSVPKASAAYGDLGILGIYDATLIVQVVMAVILYFLSHRILTRKLNLE